MVGYGVLSFSTFSQINPLELSYSSLIADLVAHERGAVVFKACYTVKAYS